MWLREISSCSCLTDLPGPALVLLSKTYKSCSSPLYVKTVVLHTRLDSLTPTKTFINTMMEKRDVELGKKFPDREFLDVIDSEIDYLRRTRIDDAEAIPKSQRRLIKSHNPLKLLPPDLLQRNKVRNLEASTILIFKLR